MNKTGKLTAAAVAVVTLLGSSAFADSRRQDGTWRDGSDRSYNDSNRRNDSNRSYRDNERVTMEGRIRNVTRERDGYRVELDRAGYSFLVPESRYHGDSRGRSLGVGVSIRLGGVFRGGAVYVDDLGWPDSGYGYSGYNNGYLRGVVDRVEYGRGLVVVRDDYSGRFVTVDMFGADRRVDLRRGDYVTLSGDFTRRGVFEAYRVESVRSGRW